MPSIVIPGSLNHPGRNLKIWIILTFFKYNQLVSYSITQKIDELTGDKSMIE